MEDALKDQVTIYAVRHEKYHNPSVYKYFFRSQLDARFMRSWKKRILGMSQNEAGLWNKPFFFSVTGSVSGSNNREIVSSTLLVEASNKINQLKPKFLVCLGDLIKFQGVEGYQLESDRLRTNLNLVNQEIPIVR